MIDDSYQVETAEILWLGGINWGNAGFFQHDGGHRHCLRVIPPFYV